MMFQRWSLIESLQSMNNLNSQTEEKQYFKARVGVMMQQYERNKQEQLLQKQQLKQNVMFQIMNNRHKQKQDPPSKRQSSASKTRPSDPFTQDIPPQNNIPPLNVNHVSVKPHIESAANSISRDNFEENQEQTEKQTKFEEMTFNMKKRNRTLEDEVTYNNPIEPKKQEQVEEEGEMDRSKSRIAKYANKYFPNLYQGANEPEEHSKQDDPEDQEQEEAQEQVVQPKSFNYPYNPSFLKEDMSDLHSSHLKRPDISQQYEPEQPEHQEQQVQQKIQEEENRGVFLTMQESQSMTASEMPKNYAFQIKMNDPDNLEEMKRQKIKQMQKKRQERIQQFRKQEAQKKVDQPKPRVSLSSSKHEKQEKQSLKSIEAPPKSTTIERKSNMHRPPKMENRSEREQHNKNQLVPLQPNQTPVQTKQNKAKKYSYQAIHENQIKNAGFKDPIRAQEGHKPISPLKTPKTVISEQRSKSGHRNSNIFAGDSQYHRQKSANRMQEPKIEPKERKNSFNRQSNKKLMINAITYVCFPGELNRKERERLVEVLETSEHEFFIFLFKEYSRKIIKGIYALDNTQTRLERIFGQKAPLEIIADRVQNFYRFDSGSRDFKKVDGCRSFSLAIHAIDLR